MSQRPRPRKPASMVVLHTCDLCSFSSKNAYIFKRHRIRCKKEHGLGRGKGPGSIVDGLGNGPGSAVGVDSGTDFDTTLDDSALNDTVDDSMNSTNDESQTSAAGNFEDSTKEDEEEEDDDDDMFNAEAGTNSTASGTDLLPEKVAAAKRRVYHCLKCDFVTKSSHGFLYHQVESHKAKHNIYTCKKCEYSSRFRHKVLRHMKAAHRIDVSILQDMEPEHVGQTSPLPKARSPVLKVRSKPRKVVMSKHSSGHKLMVKFGRPNVGAVTTAEAAASKYDTVSPLVSSIPRKTDQLSRVVKEVMVENGEVMYKCKECTFISDDKQSVAKHAVSWHVDTKSFTCSHCDYISFDRDDFTEHRLSHRNEHQFKCDECSYSTDFRPNYDRHMGNHKGSYPFTCTICSFGSASEPVVRRHTIYNHAPSSSQQATLPPPAKKLKLPVPKPSTSVEKSHSTTTTLPAPKRKTPSPQKNPEKHSVAMTTGDEASEGYLYQLNSSRSFLESDCVSMVPRPSLPPLNLENAGILSRELSPNRKLPPNITQYVEKDNGKLVCPLCNLKYKRSSDLNRHMKRKHGCKLREYLENFADTSFDKNLTIDSDVGADDNDDLIDDDNDVTSGNDTETTTSLIGEPTVSMSESDSSPISKEQLKCKYCDYEAKWMSDLKRHSSVHSFEKRYKCNYCPKKYKYLGDLNVHIRRDHKKEPGQVKVVKVATVPRKRTLPYKCKYCEYTSPWKSEVDRHSRLHKEVKTFQCSSCDYQTHWRGDIRRHVYQRHPEVLTEGVALNDVIKRNVETAHAFVPSRVSGKNYDEWNSGEEDDSMSREGTPNDSSKSMSHEASPEVNMNDYVTQTVSGHSPTPSPIKELGGGMYKCQYCGFVANAPSKMDSHIATHTNLKRYMCPVCGRRANWKWDIAKHIRASHNDQVTEVIKLSKEEAEKTVQSYMEANPIVRRDHHLNLAPDGQSSLPSDQFYKCSLCDFSAERRISVARHMRYMHISTDQSGNIMLIKRNGIDGEPSASLNLGTPSEYESDVNIKEKSVASNTVSPSSSTQTTPVKFSHLVDSFGPDEAARPFMCATCGKRGATKGDVKKHYHYAHAEQEIRIVYLGDGSQSVYAAKSDVGFTEKVVKQADPPAVPKPPKAIPPATKTSKQPKVVGYIKPFMCGFCGRRSNWRWDVNKHIRERHRGLEVQIIELTEEEARATIQEYMDKTLPELNKMANSVPKKRHKHLQQAASIAEPKPKEIFVRPVQNNEQNLMPVNKQTNTSKPALTDEDDDGNMTGQYKQYKCSGCAYRSNYRSDIMRHMPRRHGPHAHLIFLDKETAKATLAEYSYRRAYDKVQPSEVKQKHAARSTPSGPLPKEAWAGLEKKIWKCSMCAYSNEDKVDVLKHLVKHNMKAYKCTLCKWTSNFRSAVQRHIQSKHPLDNSAACKLSIKLIKEGPGVDQAGRSIMPDGLDNSGDTSPIQVKAVTGLESMANPQSFMSTALFYCKICNFSSSWRSCVCRHLARIHKRKDYIALIVKKIVRTSIQPQDASTPISMPPAAVISPKPVSAYSRKKNFHCNICPYKTYKGKMLKFHMSCHKPQPGVKQVKCKYCPYYVTSNRLLSQHLNLHIQDFQSPDTQISSYPVTPTKNSSTSISRSPSVPKRHRCEKCPYTTNSKNDFLYHKQFHRPKPTADYKCEHCDYWVSHRRLIKQHMKVHEQGNMVDYSAVTPAKSDYSESSFIYDTVEIAAIKQRIISSKITASISQSPLVSPMKIASGCSVGGRRSFLRKDGTYRKIHQCRHCPYMNIRLRNMKLHEMMHGKRSATHVLMKCPHCDYYVGSKGLLAHHMKVHQPNYGIEFIGQEKDKDRKDSRTSEDSEMDNSTAIPLENKVDTLLEITRFKKYGCEKCPYASSKRSRFQRHVELHGSKQKCKCDFCDYCVPTMNLLNQHMRLHFEPNQNLLAAQSILNLQYLPEMPADVALASMITNNDSKHPVSITHDHIDLYENQPDDFEPKKLYRCDRCPYANICRSNLLGHLRCHMLKNEHACPYCDYSAGKPHVLMQHVKVHFSPLPELSDWITENGGAERLKEVKNTDLKEAIEVAKFFQSEKKAGKLKDSQNVGNVVEVTAGSVNEDGTAIDKELESDPLLNEDKKKAQVKGGDENETEQANKSTEDAKDEVEKTTEESAAHEVGEKKKVTEDTGMKDSPKTGVSDETTYVCQYCDQDYPTSDCLVRHEMKHLIGNSYEDLVSQLLKAAEMQNVDTKIPDVNGNAVDQKGDDGGTGKDEDFQKPSTSGVTKETTKTDNDVNGEIDMETD